MPSNSLLRLEARAPGYVREPKRVCTRKILLFCYRWALLRWATICLMSGEGCEIIPRIFQDKTDGWTEWLLAFSPAYLLVCLSCLTCLCVCLSVCVSVRLFFFFFFCLFAFWFTLFSTFQTKQQAPGGRVISSTAEAEQALTNLESLRVNKQYTSLAEHIMEAHSFIANPLHSLMEGPQFVAKLVRQLFPNDRALAIVATWIIGIMEKA